MKIGDLKGEQSHLVDFWITDSACLLKSGSVAYTQYHDYGGGSLILREIMDDSHPDSPAGLERRAKEMKSNKAH